ncbi:MAG TPA: DNA methyltransferase [Beijerinckiaceae bacterium]|nr:DNA methyltransferase [Beijerinckiaceae bacterium]
MRSPASLRANPRNARTRTKREIRRIADSIESAGNLQPIVVDEDDLILAGHGRLAAAKLLGLEIVPTIKAVGLTDAQKRLFAIADNKLTENAGWDREALAKEFAELAELLEREGLELAATGFDPAEIDAILHDFGADFPGTDDAAPKLQTQAVSRTGDLWLLGQHRLMCGDARSSPDVETLMAGAKARMAFADPPYNLKIASFQGRGRTKHREFLVASGEQSREEFIALLQETSANIAAVCVDGAIVFMCMDWRHMGEMLAAGEVVFGELKNLIVWNKTSPGQGSFYRSQHELIFAWKVGDAEHVNAFGLGAHGRMRANVWNYPGTNNFKSGCRQDLALHPTVKPVALIADALRDCSMKGDIVVDLFMGSGTTIMAAEKVGRRAYGMELDPLYVDVAVRRWKAATKADVILSGDGQTFEEVAAARLVTAAGANAPVDDQNWVALVEGWPAASTGK